MRMRDSFDRIFPDSGSSERTEAASLAGALADPAVPAARALHIFEARGGFEALAVREDQMTGAMAALNPNVDLDTRRRLAAASLRAWGESLDHFAPRLRDLLPAQEQIELISSRFELMIQGSSARNRDRSAYLLQGAAVEVWLGVAAWRDNTPMWREDREFVNRAASSAATATLQRWLLLDAVPGRDEALALVTAFPHAWSAHPRLWADHLPAHQIGALDDPWSRGSRDRAYWLGIDGFADALLAEVRQDQLDASWLLAAVSDPLLSAASVEILLEAVDLHEDPTYAARLLGHVNAPLARAREIVVAHRAACDDEECPAQDYAPLLEMRERRYGARRPSPGGLAALTDENELRWWATACQTAVEGDWNAAQLLNGTRPGSDWSVAAALLANPHLPQDLVEPLLSQARSTLADALYTRVGDELRKATAADRSADWQRLHEQTDGLLLTVDEARELAEADARNPVAYGGGYVHKLAGRVSTMPVEEITTLLATAAVPLWQRKFTGV